jgi:hypothetical protein
VNDVKDLLGLALDTGPAEGTEADPREDLARGRSLLRRRRLLAGAGVAAAMVAGAAVPLALQGGSGVSNGHGPVAASAKPVIKTTEPSVPSASSPSPSRSRGGHVALVAWTGTQPPGYEVSWMPAGWVVQGSTPYYLTIAPAGDKDTQPDSFLGKLVVMLQSKSVTSPPSGQSQPVNGRRGVFEPAAEAGGDTEILTFQVPGGQWAVVQAPMALGWSSQQLAQFAGGVKVLVTAQRGVG